TTAATTLRVRLTPTSPTTLTLHTTDPTGNPVATIDTITLRTHNPEELGVSRIVSTDSLYRVGWIPADTGKTAEGEPELSVVSSPKLAARLEAAGITATAYPGIPSLTESVSSGAPGPHLVLAEIENATGIHAVTREALKLYQAWLNKQQTSTARLAILTRGAVDVTGSDDIRDAAGAAVRAMARSAQWEHPGHLLVLDIDDEDSSLRALSTVVATDEPELAVRKGSVLMPRLARAGAAEPSGVLDPDGTVLITGGTGTVGSTIARHVVAEYGVRHLVLAGRRGPDADGVAGLMAGIKALGADVRVEACDVTDRDATSKLLAGIPAEHPVTAVLHIAGTEDDCAITELTPERLDAVLRPKVDAAWNLHELTRELDLKAFVLFSSASAIAGNPGHGAFAAANACLDVLAQQRRAGGLPALSLAWSPWAQHGNGIRAISVPDAMRMFDGALAHGGPVLMPVKLDFAELRAQAVSDSVPALLRGLVPRGRRVAEAIAATRGAFAERLGALPPADRERELLSLVRLEAAAILGHTDGDTVSAERAFNELGFDSLTAVQLRNRLTAVTGVPLPATLVFDYPNSAALARLLQSELFDSGADDTGSTLAQLDRLAETLSGLPLGGELDGEVAIRLQNMLSQWKDRSKSARPDVAERLETASAAALFDFIDNELGRVNK
ncbi:MAG TPA: beta-ketoacyl reductase, partial [Amycolatopsis sp.]|uniref:type I polyketide synthase n=1 Tax=Amycolatopsis sp. TaxID=37632 RepID=UPI002B48C5B3